MLGGFLLSFPAVDWYRVLYEIEFYPALIEGISWKNNFPILRRRDYPLIFDREMKPKKAYWELIRLMEEKTP
jgi:hypothetical protein